ncbi:MAG: phospholipid carrier-dependent glycosyltransferase [Chloroflexi bacterium]|nr:phospholipid carrier-dependent glycosyltransferase [Chloroflexota bacterium]
MGSSEKQRGRRALGAMVVVFVVLCVFYNFATPLFEGSDEGPHYNFVDYLASHGALPDLDNKYVRAIAETRQLPILEQEPGTLGHEITQPPLYYAAGAALIFWIDRSDFAQIHKTADIKSHGLVNYHTPAEMAFPPTGTVLAVRLVRLLSTALGALMVVLSYAIASLLFKRMDVALLTAAITAFNPKFIHLSSVITNDIAVACMVTLALWVAANIMVDTRADARRFALRAAMLGACAGLAGLSKYSGMAVFAPAGVALLWYVVQHRRTLPLLQTLALGVLACAIGFAAITGWFFVYNLVRYGHPLAWAQVQAANTMTMRGSPLPLSDVIASIPMLMRTYWGIFGDGIQAPPDFDAPQWVILVVASVGLVVALVRRQLPKESILLVISGAATLVAFFSWMRQYGVTDNSRLISPIAVTVSAFCAAGLLAWLPAKLRTGSTYILGALAAGWAVFIPTVALLPNYQPPVYLTPEQESALPSQGRMLFENGIELLSASLRTNRIDAGGMADLTLYWRATRPITVPYAMVLEAFDDQEHSLGRISTGGYLGRQFMIPEWQPGRALRIDYHLPISAPQQTMASIFVGWYEQHPPNRLVHVAETSGVSAQVGRVKVRGALPPEKTPAQRVTASLGDVIQLEGYTACGDKLSLFWRSTGTPGRDYTVFVHALDEQGHVIGQSDAPVTYPTLFWGAGEQVIDDHLIDRLAGARALRLGMYAPDTGERLIASKPDGSAWDDNVVRIDLQPQADCR